MPVQIKTTKAKSAGGVAQMVEHLLSQHKALSSTYSTKKKKNQNQGDSFYAPDLF
jgi:hypothetical protein